MSSVNINTRIDSETKDKAVEVFHKLGITTSQAISAFFRQVILNNGIPFELKIPNKTTVDTFNKTDKGQDLHKVSGLEALKRELKS